MWTSFPVSVRYSVVSKTKDFNRGALPGEEYQEFGRDYQESEKVAKMLEEAGYDMLDCDNGSMMRGIGHIHQYICQKHVTWKMLKR